MDNCGKVSCIATIFFTFVAVIGLIVMNYLIHSDLSSKIEMLFEAVGQDNPSAKLSSQIEILSTALQHQTDILTRDQFCPANGGVSFINTGNCYLESSQATSDWNEARAECQKNGGDLATIDSQATQDFLVKKFKRHITISLYLDWSWK